jgi:hypothetical protein
MYIFAKIAAEHIFLQNHDKINIYKKIRESRMRHYWISLPTSCTGFLLSICLPVRWFRSQNEGTRVFDDGTTGVELILLVNKSRAYS